ncbi:hypothetical protein GCM10009835_05190 [Planosporangium flavigriseum]|uniref:Uncharacterized protein n=1 Tax=Planosporangium flavigriseum TaxID=373681 RepID=A0A8J3LKN2_9ACTN|nr:hypothetical protein Pfl04_15430 [Planosporangium flavigriseum]
MELRAPPPADDPADAVSDEPPELLSVDEAQALARAAVTAKKAAQKIARRGRVAEVVT